MSISNYELSLRNQKENDEIDERRKEARRDDYGISYYILQVWWVPLLTYAVIIGMYCFWSV